MCRIYSRVVYRFYQTDFSVESEKFVRKQTMIVLFSVFYECKVEIRIENFDLKKPI